MDYTPGYNRGKIPQGERPMYPHSPGEVPPPHAHFPWRPQPPQSPVRRPNDKQRGTR